MRLQALVYFYGRRLRTHPVQEFLAGMGIAIGVALAFAVMVASASVVASAGEIVRGVTGSADLQLAARDSNGFDDSVLEDVRQLAGVQEAAPLLERRAVLVGPNRKQASINLVSVDPSLANLSGRLIRSFVPGGLQLASGGIMLPTAAADAVGIPNPAAEGEAKPLPQVEVHLRGRSQKVTIAAVLGPDTVGPLTGAKVGIMPLDYLQELAGTPNRVSRIFVDAAPGREAEVRDELNRLAGGRLTVAPADADTRLLEQATGPTDQVTGFFAAISALLGLLLAFNAMLLTAPERRRLVSALRIQGYKPRQVVLLILFQAAVLGVVASTVGVLAGMVFSNGLFSESPDYLEPGFTLGSGTIIGAVPLLLSLGGGIVASCLAAAPPLLDLRRGRAVDAVFHDQGTPGHALDRRTRNRMLLAAAASYLAATALLLWTPQLALLASAMLALGTLLAIPTTFAAVTAVMAFVIDRVPRFSTLTVALLAMRATTLRSLALAATGAVAVFGSVAIGGARDDLLRGIADYTNDYVGTADIWVVNPADNQATNDFHRGGLVSRVAAAPGVKAVREYQGSFLDVRGRRAWIIARPPGDPDMLPPSSLIDGDLETANAKLRSGGWIGLSQQIASDHGMGLGDVVTLPTPTGNVRYRIAATTTNLGWAPGAIILNRDDYRRAWNNTAPSALEVDVRAGADPEATRRAVENALGGAAAGGLRVQHAATRGAQIKASAQQGLERLSQISMLLQVAAILAMAAAMGAAIWQRRPALAALRIQSFKPRQLWLLLLLEAGIVLSAGGLTGALGGIYGQFGADRFLEMVTGFPVSPVAAGWQTIRTFGLVVLAALMIVAVPGWLAARVPPRLGLGAE
jgi:putative ABC transport system permease protein